MNYSLYIVQVVTAVAVVVVSSSTTVCISYTDLVSLEVATLIMSL